MLAHELASTQVEDFGSCIQKSVVLLLLVIMTAICMSSCSCCNPLTSRNRARPTVNLSAREPQMDAVLDRVTGGLQSKEMSEILNIDAG